MSPTCPTVSLRVLVHSPCLETAEPLSKSWMFWRRQWPCEGIRLRCLALSTITQRVPLTTLRLTGEMLGGLSLTPSLTWRDESNQPKSLDG